MRVGVANRLKIIEICGGAPVLKLCREEPAFQDSGFLVQQLETWRRDQPKPAANAGTHFGSLPVSFTIDLGFMITSRNTLALRSAAIGAIRNV